MQAAIYGLAGERLSDRRARLLPRCRSRRLHPVRPQLRRPRPASRADRRACATLTRPRRCADPDRPGRRPRRAAEAARMARFPRRPPLRRALRAGADERDRGGARQCPGDRAHPRRGRNQRRLPARARRPPGRARARSSATAPWAPSRCRSPRSAAPRSTGSRRAAWSGVVKHMPGHGRARVDSHKELPVVDARRGALAVDLAPFRRSRRADGDGRAYHLHHLGCGAAVRASRRSSSRTIIRGRIGFDGFLMTDDLGMEALSGGFGERAAARARRRLRRGAPLLGRDGGDGRRRLCCRARSARRRGAARSGDGAGEAARRLLRGARREERPAARARLSP